MIFIYKEELIYSLELEQKFEGQVARLIVNEIDMRALFGLISTTNTRVQVINETTNKVIKEIYWDNTTKALVEQKKVEYKPSFFLRVGKIIIFAVIVIAILVGGLFATIEDHKKTQQNAVENFNKVYDPQDKTVWLESLKSGDIILANQQYHDPVQVFKIIEFTDKGVVLEAFEQFIPTGEYEELDKLNTLNIGNTSVQITVSRSKLLNGIVYDTAVDSSAKQLYIRQIRKAK